jgi:hypothetical protein
MVHNLRRAQLIMRFSAVFAAGGTTDEAARTPIL